MDDTKGHIQTAVIITKTCLYNFDPLKPHFYVVKLGFIGVYIIVLISAQKHWLRVLVRTARRGGTTSTHNLCFEQKYENYQIFFYLKIFIFWLWNFQYIWIGMFSKCQKRNKQTKRNRRNIDTDLERSTSQLVLFFLCRSIYPTYSDKQAWANNVDFDQTPHNTSRYAAFAQSFCV